MLGSGREWRASIRAEQRTLSGPNGEYLRLWIELDDKTISREGDWYIMPAIDARDEKRRFRYGGGLEVHGLVLSKTGREGEFSRVGKLTAEKGDTWYFSVPVWTQRVISIV